MKQSILCVQVLSLAMLVVPVAAVAADSQPLQASEIKWGEAPAILPAGAKMAVMAGDPSATGYVSLRVKFPAGYRIPAHWHPSDEHVTVISGTFSIGMGDKFDMKHGKTLKAGGYAIAPANMNHYAWTKTGAIIEINLMGPFGMTYVNPADDPTRK